MNRIIIIHLSEWIEFNFDRALITIKLSIGVTLYYFFVCMENERNCEWRTLIIIDTSFINAITNLFLIIIFRFNLLRELSSLKHLNYFVNKINKKLEESTIKILLVLL